MPDHKEERLKKLIQTVLPETPAPQFTARVMDDVRAVAAPETAPDPALGGLLRGTGLETPPAYFTRAVMDQVTAAGQAVSTAAPIIPVRAWYGVAAVLTGLVTWVAASGSVAPPSHEVTLWAVAVRGLLRALSAGIQILPVSLVLIAVAVSVLLGIEYAFRYGAASRTLRSKAAGQ